MEKKELILIRGLPNSGKTSFANLYDTPFCYAADDFFENHARELGLTYNDVFSYDLVHQAHNWCQSQVWAAMEIDAPLIVVHNVFTRRYHMRWYLKTAEDFGYRVHIVIVDRHHENDNGHNVPEERIEEMASKFQFFDTRMKRER